MNSVIIKIIIHIVISLSSLIMIFKEHDRKDKKEKILFWCAIFTFIANIVTFFVTIEVPKPYIKRESDYSAIVLETDESMDIEYKISTDGDSSDKWIKYKGPFQLEKGAVIYARTKVLCFTSEEIYRDAYVTENGLVYFSGAEKPGDTIISIKASYNYKDAVMNGDSGNHYSGYEIKKSDITVIGTDLNGNEKQIQDFVYSPKILKSGKNDIKIEYLITDDISVENHLYVNGDEPVLTKLNVKHKGGNVYIGTMLDSNDFIVQGLYEDGTIKNITGYSISPVEVQNEKNKIKITKDGLTSTVELNAIDPETITENEIEPNNEIETANEIDVNVKYSGILGDRNDIDYYKLRLDKKGKIIIKLTHSKIDEDHVFWKTSLLSQQEDVRVEMESIGKNAETKSSSARVSPGVYYIKVESGYHSNEKYTITVLFEEEGDSYENEPNDDLNMEAMPIKIDNEYTGNLTNKNDIDYYKFSLSEKRKVWIDFSHDKMNARDSFWKISLFDDSDGEILDFDSIGEVAKLNSDTVRLSEGNYYIKIEPYYWSDLDYTFCVHSKEEGKEAESEDNNDYNTATEIEIGADIIGNIQSKDDVDFYKFELKSPSSVKIKFTHPQVDNNNIFWQLELHSEEVGDSIKNSEDDKVVLIRGNSAKTISSTWNSLPKGIYYLKIDTYYYDNGDYKFSLLN